jgi:NAD(P)-dependent dehydrogenase (short-subunit alcohol dehydrogenase family)
MTIKARHAVITGGSRGIGRGIALKLAEHGVKIAVNYLRDEAAAKATLVQIRAAGSDGFIHRGDVSKPEEVKRLFDRVKEEFGGVDIFINNARGEVSTFYEPTMTIGLDKFDAAMDSQAKAFLVGARAAAEQMRAGGRIVAITFAPGGRFGSWQSWVAMGAAKAALEVVSRYLAVALAPRGITVNAISPGWVEDTVLNTLPEPVVQMIRDWHKSGWTPMGRIGTTADIGNAVSLLCSEEAGWITGQTIAVDGGAGLMDSCLPLGIQQPAVAQPA